MWRTYNISKAEWVLNGKSVVYAPWQSIRDTLDYDFEKERVFSYGSLTLEEIIQHLASFTSGIWQIHPFCEGNTRTTAVFILKYMKAFGLSIYSKTIPGIFATLSCAPTTTTCRIIFTPPRIF